MFILNIYTFRCLALPWLIFSMLEILILGCPAVIFFSLLGIYLYIQVNFYTQHLPVYPGTLLIYTWHLYYLSRYTYILGIIPVYPGTYIYLASNLYNKVLFYTRHLPVYPGTPLYSASTYVSRHTYILGATCISRYTVYLASTCIFK